MWSAALDKLSLPESRKCRTPGPEGGSVLQQGEPALRETYSVKDSDAEKSLFDIQVTLYLC